MPCMWSDYILIYLHGWYVDIVYWARRVVTRPCLFIKRDIESQSRINFSLELCILSRQFCFGTEWYYNISICGKEKHSFTRFVSFCWGGSSFMLTTSGHFVIFFIRIRIFIYVLTWMWLNISDHLKKTILLLPLLYMNRAYYSFTHSYKTAQEIFTRAYFNWLCVCIIRCITHASFTRF